MDLVRLAPLAVLALLELFSRRALVLGRVVIVPLALAAREANHISHGRILDGAATGRGAHLPTRCRARQVGLCDPGTENVRARLRRARRETLRRVGILARARRSLLEQPGNPHASHVTRLVLPRLTDLTLAQPGSRTLRAWHAAALARLASRILALPQGPPSSLRRAAHTQFANLARRSPDRLAQMLHRPAVAAVIPRDEFPTDELDLHGLCEFAATGDLDAPIDVPRPTRGWPTMVLVPSARAQLVVPAWASTVRLRNGGGDVLGDGMVSSSFAFGSVDTAERSDGISLRAFVPIAEGIDLALADNNPLAGLGFHPERPGNPVSLGDRALQAWTTPLRESLGLVTRFLPGIGEEMRALLQVIVPVGTDEERHFSCSYENAPGAVYLSLHPNVMAMTEALLHEFQHNKLHAIRRIDPLIVGGNVPSFHSPVRPDARPLVGVLEAVHAFHAVAALYEAMTAAGHPLARGRDWPARYANIVRINRDAATTVLRHGTPTRSGRDLFEEIRRIENHFANA